MPPSTFSLLPEAKLDPIFAMAAMAKTAGPEKIDASIGIYRGEENEEIVLQSTKNAMEEWVKTMQPSDFGYPPLLGLPLYRSAVTRLVYGEATSVASCATTGGTGALRMNLQLFKRMLPDARVILPLPSWVNHHHLCAEAGLPIEEVPYFSGDGTPTVGPLIAALRMIDAPVGILLQAGCHNPSGRDLSLEDWEALIEAIAERQARGGKQILLIDFAYQGFKADPEEDSAPIRLCAKAGIDALVAWSASKNHTVYGFRVGLACAHVAEEKLRATVEGHFASIIRGIHSAAATPGQAIVARVQESHGDLWRRELRGIRETLLTKRETLVHLLPRSMHAALDGSGLFALLPLDTQNIASLREKHSVFLNEDGRMNIAGIPASRLEEFCRHVTAVA